MVSFFRAKKLKENRQSEYAKKTFFYDSARDIDMMHNSVENVKMFRDLCISNCFFCLQD